MYPHSPPSHTAAAGFLLSHPKLGAVMADVDPEQAETIQSRLELAHRLHLHDAAIDALRELHDLQHPDEDQQWFGYR